MKPDWEQVLGRLRAYAPETHRILPPCLEERIESVQENLGRMPDALIGMLRYFNGAELFTTAGPLITIFGISAIPPLPPLEWAPDWYIDRFTPAWRASRNCQHEWAIAMSNYGGLIVLDEKGMTKEWDTSQRTWGPTDVSFDEWVEGLLNEGDVCLREMNGDIDG